MEGLPRRVSSNVRTGRALRGRIDRRVEVGEDGRSPNTWRTLVSCHSRPIRWASDGLPGRRAASSSASLRHPRHLPDVEFLDSEEWELLFHPLILKEGPQEGRDRTRWRAGPGKSVR